MSDPASGYSSFSSQGTPAYSRAELPKPYNPASAIQFKNDYLRLSKTMTYSYLFVIPLFIIYELGVWFINMGHISQVRIGADVYIKSVFSLIGLDNTLWFGLGLLIVGGVIYLKERREDITLYPRYFAYMLAESAFYAVTIGLLVAFIVAQIFPTLIPPLQVTGEPVIGHSLLRDIIFSLGAGAYEELFFRLILVTLIYLLLKLVKMSDRLRYILAAIVGAGIFSWVHYVGAYGDDFALSSFTFRFLMGLALNWLFLLRGFGIAAMTHALYDVFVFITR